MLLSVCIIVRDKATFVSRTINSVKNIADEIIIIDTGSCDNTKFIAMENSVKMLFYKWDYNFSRVKNFAIEKAKGDWVLLLDADEELGGDGTDLRSNLKEQEYDGIFLPVIKMNFEKVEIPHLTLRIIKQKSNINLKGSRNEQADIEVKDNLNVKILQLPIINHNLYNKDLFLDENDLFFSKNLGLDTELKLIEDKRYRVALNELELKFKADENPYLLSNIIFLLFKIDNEKKASQKIKLGCNKYQEDGAIFKFWQSYFDFKRAEYRQAGENLNCVLKKSDVTNNILGNIYILLGSIYKNLDKLEQAIFYFKKAYFIKPHNSYLLGEIVDLFRTNEIIRVFTMNEDSNLGLILKMFNKRNRYEKGLEFIRKIGNKSGDELLFWKSYYLLNLDRFELAEMELKKVSPGFNKYDQVLDLLWIIKLDKGSENNMKSIKNQIKLLGNNLSWKIINAFDSLMMKQKQIVFDFKSLHIKYKFYYKCFYYLDLMVDFAEDRYIDFMIEIIKKLKIKSVDSDLGNLFYNHKHWEKSKFFLDQSMLNGLVLSDLSNLADIYYLYGEMEISNRLYQKVLNIDDNNYHAYYRLNSEKDMALNQSIRSE